MANIKLVMSVINLSLKTFQLIIHIYAVALHHKKDVDQLTL